MGAVIRAFEDDLYPALDRKQTEMPVVPEGARKSTMNINAIHPIVFSVISNLHFCNPSYPSRSVIEDFASGHIRRHLAILFDFE